MGKVSVVDALKSVLTDLSSSSDDIEACAVVSIDGLLMASNFAEDMDVEKIASMTAALLAMGERTARELNRGHLEQVFVRGANGLVILMSAGDELVLVTLCSIDAKMGAIFLNMNSAAAEIAKIM
jgi:predicted regulator of Ras-like GTPase activity (Roadblock/LC7/MglB family)